MKTTSSHTQADLTITVPVQIDRRLTPNGRAHWWVKNDLVQALRTMTCYAVRNANIEMWEPTPPLVLDYEIGHGKGRKRLDDTNAIASMKPIEDQIASCLGIDDRHFRFGSMTQTRDPSGMGYVRVTIRESTR
jgi:hypothetical protein